MARGIADGVEWRLAQVDAVGPAITSLIKDGKAFLAAS
jgi:hypothetical protein